MAKKKYTRKPTTLKQALATGARFIEPKAHPQYYEVRGSTIHGRGVFAKDFIETGTKVVEYIGEKITKKESDRRGWEQMEKSQKTGEAGVYLFTLN
ncbi:MAG: SET domain-containing protein-lysine N-methyltransferase, partial [Verrucomicrobiota bacterium]